MATNFEWKITDLERHTADGIVFVCHYLVNADNATYPAGAYGSLGLEPPEPDTMIPFEDLTEEIVVGWVKDKLGEEQVAKIKQALQAQINEEHAPTKATGVPWAELN